MKGTSDKKTGKVVAKAEKKVGKKEQKEAEKGRKPSDTSKISKHEKLSKKAAKRALSSDSEEAAQSSKVGKAASKKARVEDSADEGEPSNISPRSTARIFRGPPRVHGREDILVTPKKLDAAEARILSLAKSSSEIAYAAAQYYEERGLRNDRDEPLYTQAELDARFRAVCLPVIGREPQPMGLRSLTQKAKKAVVDLRGSVHP